MRRFIPPLVGALIALIAAVSVGEPPERPTEAQAATAQD